MEIMSASIPENFSEGGSTTRDRSIWFSIAQSALGLLLMEVRPKQFGPRSIATSVVPQTMLFPIFTDTQGTKEGGVGESPFFDNTIAPTWQSQAW